MRYTKSYIEMRILSLEKNPVEIAKLIKQWSRRLRRGEAEAKCQK